ncbi:uncharacterized protein BYT42DRAFT_644659 [Radiomyces spectabilis]|uniref:uncharacterized protein n=1 Tax=Radiomyces spectabilis TaxID=64574 RepID=UPI00222011D5|nr:uncharacterized protein BYT42DRAFT_644659 [Radiomyces spectabilis]KAI8379377.1 hypothetical protein BYT42DRAFT_644659 [Radiomyces spectabilis]
MKKKSAPGLLADVLLGEKSASVNNELDALFKNSAGPSSVTIHSTVPKKPVDLTEKQAKMQAHKELEAIKKAQALGEAMSRKRKADAMDDETDASNKKSPEQIKAEEQEKEQRTVFVGNLSVKCIEKAGYKALKAKFQECGTIQSIRFRSVALAIPMNRKAAFLSGKIHSSRDVLNAYIVYKEKEAVNKAVAMNGQIFMEKHLRVDSVAAPKPHDRKRSVFLGSLPFDVQEEELWAFFKDCGEVESVRVVRDKSTNIGKGIGYVQFVDRDSVDTALALEDKQFREKHKIRIQRCKLSVSEGGQPSAPPKQNKKQKTSGKDNRKGGKPQGARGAKGAGKGGKPLPGLKRFEGTRATRDTGKKFKLQKTSSKNNAERRIKNKH